MNERIKLLAVQAGLEFTYDPTFIYDPTETPMRVFVEAWGEDLEKFAELIVRECMDAVGDGPMQRPEIQRIKAKFGVEYYEPIEKAFRS
jgi:hypothetical protein